MPNIQVVSRESPLALVQTHFVMGLLAKLSPELEIGLTTCKTQGDKFLDVPLSAIGDKGLFVKELEESLLRQDTDLAVHSLKDMLSELPTGLTMQSISPREDVRDAFLNCHGQTLYTLPTGALVGTASLRRVSQLKKLRPDLRYEMVRGNLQTRFQKLQSGQYDALILAAAGVSRMGWLSEEPMKSAITHYFDPITEIIPAVGQGVLAVEYRNGHQDLKTLLDELTDNDTEIAMRAERAFLKRLEGGCRLPVAAYARKVSDMEFEMVGAVFSLDGEKTIADTRRFKPDILSAEATGLAIAECLLENGASDILRALTP